MSVKMDINLWSRSIGHSCYIHRLIVCALVILLFFSFESRAFAANEYAVFSLNSEFEELTRSKVRMLYRGKAKSLQGKRVEISDWPESSVQRAEFYRFLLGKDTAQMNAYWASLSFSGKARPPKEIHTASVESLLSWLNENPNRIGYAPLELVPNDAKILLVVGKGK